MKVEPSPTRLDTVIRPSMFATFSWRAEPRRLRIRSEPKAHRLADLELFFSFTRGETRE